MYPGLKEEGFKGRGRVARSPMTLCAPMVLGHQDDNLVLSLIPSSCFLQSLRVAKWKRHIC